MNAIEELAAASAAIDKTLEKDAYDKTSNDIAAASREINEALFMKRMQHEAGLRGYRVRTKADLKRMLSERPSELPAVSTSIDTDPITSIKSDTDTILIKLPPKDPLTEILKNVSDEFTVGDAPIWDEKSVRLTCRRGHTHDYLRSCIQKSGLKECYTCSCRDKYLAKMHRFMEEITSLPFIIDGKNKISSDAAKITIHRSTTYQATKVWIEQDRLFFSVQSNKSCITELKKKIRSIRFTMPNGKLLRDRAVCDSPVFDDTRCDPEGEFFTFMDKLNTPACVFDMNIKW